MNQPSVSIVMPVRNEADHIRTSLAAVVAQDYPAHRACLAFRFTLQGYEHKRAL